MTSLHLCLLGPFHLTINDEPLTAPLWSKTQALLAYLAVEANRPHRREALAGMLWPEQPEEQSRNSLRQALHQLSRAIPKQTTSLLVTTSQTVQLNPEAAIQLDLHLFQQAVQAVDGHDHRRREACHRCMGQLKQAIALYQGDFLAELALKDSDLFEDWATVQREQLRRQAVAMWRDLSGYYALQNQVVDMAEAAEQWLMLDPFDDAAQRHLMMALSWQGRQNNALQRYQRYCQRLASELNLPPEPETEQLAQQISKGALPAPSSLLRRWPVQLTGFVGREALLDQVGQLLQAPTTRLVTLLGTGGIGKTRLAIEAVEREAIAFTGGACFVSLAPLVRAEAMIPALAEALGLDLNNNLELKGQLWETLQKENLLLLLDNLEHLPDVPPLIAEILRKAPGVVMVTTSRAPLHLSAEQCFPVEPLSLAEANLLFKQRVQAIQPAVTFQEADEGVIATICSKLDRLPLGIELAAVRTRHFALATLAARLENQLTFLSQGPRDLPDRQQTLQATIAWSYDLLSKEEQVAFVKLSVFVGPILLEAAIAVSNSDEPTIHALIDHSLLQPADHEQYLMLETIRAFALAKLAEQGLEAAARLNHATYFFNWVKMLMLDLHTAEQDQIFQQITQQYENIRLALVWELAHNTQMAVELTNSLWIYWFRRGLGAEAISWYKQALAADTKPTEARARALTCAASAVGLQGDNDLACQYLEESLMIFQQLDDAIGMGEALRELGWQLHILQDHVASTAAFKQSLIYFRVAETLPRYAEVAASLVQVLWHQPNYDYDEAYRLIDESLAIYRELEDSDGLAFALVRRALLFRDTHNAEAGRCDLLEALELAYANNLTYRVMDCLENLGDLEEKLVNIEQACTHWTNCYQVAVEIGDVLVQRRILAVLAKYET